MKRIVLAAAGLLAMSSVALAGHPLVTDDTGTQGRGKGQVEVGISFFRDKDNVDEFNTFQTEGGEAAAGITVGLLDNLDIVLSVPYLWFSRDENDVRLHRADGLLDISFDAKWRFFKKNGWSLALKPGISLPSGDDDQGLGSGRTSGCLFMIGTKEIEPVAVHANLGYVRNENNFDERKDIWLASVAAEVNVLTNLKILANVGVERSVLPGNDNHPAFALGGISYDVSERITVDAGVKYGLASSETDWTYLAGLTIRF